MRPSPMRLEQTRRHVVRSFLARARSRKARVPGANPEVHSDEVSGRGGSPGGERSSCRRVGAVGPVAVLACVSRQGCRVGAERRDLERCRGRSIELLLEREVAPGILGRSGLRIAQRDEGVLPHAPVGMGELDRALADGVGLGGDTGSLVPAW